MTYFFETYGCQMNLAESASIEQLFISHSWTKSETAENANVIIINTCSVRETAETRIHGRLGWYTALRRQKTGKKDGKIDSCGGFTLIVTGCMAERLKTKLQKKFPVVDYVMGTFQKEQFSDVINAVENNQIYKPVDEEPVYRFASSSYEKGLFTSFVPIMHGCNNFCTYCIVPYVRGREISRSPKDIFAELDLLSKKRVREITLLGQNVNSYSWKNEDGTYIDFPTLMQMIADYLKKTESSIGWVRFMSSHPKDLSEKLIDVISKEDVICKHIHLPVQHGSNIILKKMNRNYTREHYLHLIEEIRTKIPSVSLTTDVMLGFPGETDDDFLQTVSLMNQVKYESAFMYYYNPREGTPASTYANQIPISVKKERLAKIIDMQQLITHDQMQKRVGQTVKVLVESVSHNDKNEVLAKTEQDERVAFLADSKNIGEFMVVKLTELKGNTFRGVVAKENIK